MFSACKFLVSWCCILNFLHISLRSAVISWASYPGRPLIANAISGRVIQPNGGEGGFLQCDWQRLLSCLLKVLCVVERMCVAHRCMEV
jgi:hypothetical protein